MCERESHAPPAPDTAHSTSSANSSTYCSPAFAPAQEQLSPRRGRYWNTTSLGSSAFVSRGAMNPVGNTSSPSAPVVESRFADPASASSDDVFRRRRTLRHATTLTPGLCSTVAHSSSSSPQEAETGSEKATTISTTSGPSALRVAVSRSFGGIPPPPLYPNTVPAIARAVTFTTNGRPSVMSLLNDRLWAYGGLPRSASPGLGRDRSASAKTHLRPESRADEYKVFASRVLRATLNPPSTLGGDAPSAPPRAAQMPRPAVAFRSIWNLLTSAPQRGDASQMVFQSRRFSAIPASAGSAKTLCSAFHAAKTSASTPSAAASPTPSSRT